MQRRTFLTLCAVGGTAASGGLLWNALRDDPLADRPVRPPSPASVASVPAGYPRSYAQIIEAAKQEGVLSIYSATRRPPRVAAPCWQTSAACIPASASNTPTMNSTEIYSRFIAEVAAREGTADFLWSSAMDLQIKLVNDGYAQAYASPEKPALPDSAVWKNEAYGTTAEPIVFAYNKRLMPAGDVPHSHAELTALLQRKPDFYRDKITSYNPEKSGVGFLYITQDAQVTGDTWDFVRALGPTAPKLYTSTGAMMERVVSGESLLAFNMIGSYALERSSKDPSVGVILPNDLYAGDVADRVDPRRCAPPQRRETVPRFPAVETRAGTFARASHAVDPLRCRRARRRGRNPAGHARNPRRPRSARQPGSGDAPSLPAALARHPWR